MNKQKDRRKIMFKMPTRGAYVDRNHYLLNVVYDSLSNFAYSKGHHDRELFCAMAEKVTGSYFDHGTVQYRWVRMVPAKYYDRKLRKSVHDGRHMVMCDSKPDSKGAFPITYCEKSFIQ